MMIGVGRRAAQAAADGQAVFARHHQIEHDQVEVLAGAQASICAPSPRP
jgi:hypothetical protein